MMQTNIGIHLVWGCDPQRQFESAWIRYLLNSSIISESELWHIDHFSKFVNLQIPTILVESGLIHLEKNPSQVRIHNLIQDRKARLSILSAVKHLRIIHLSDEEGNDADLWYPLLPKQSVIWRNFSHSRLLLLGHSISIFPIGPRAPFLDFIVDLSSESVSNFRNYPWTFMGTLWPSGSRRLAVSLFLYSIPQGFYFGSISFAQGLPLDQYSRILSDSWFSLAPEGDRHLDTFRLWESLCCGCLPLIVDFKDSAASLIPQNYPLPIFSNWKEALRFSQFLLSDRSELVRFQGLVFQWWLSSVVTLSTSIRSFD